MTGDVTVGGAVAPVEPAVNTVGFHFHERMWRRFERRRPGAEAAHAGYDNRKKLLSVLRLSISHK
jgi:uncharacterized membrane protein